MKHHIHSVIVSYNRLSLTMWRNRREQVAMHMKVQAELFPEGMT